MSGDNVDAVRAVYEQWADGNFRAGVDLYDPYVVLVWAPEFPDPGAYVGAAAIAEKMRDFLEAWDEMTIAAEELIGAGDHVVVAVVQRAVGRGSGAEPTELRYFQVWSFRGGKAIRIDVIRDRNDALASVGLPA